MCLHALHQTPLKEPPKKAVYFNTVTDSGETSQQVFEYNAMYRLISIRGAGDNADLVLHPATRATIDRRQALALIEDVPPGVQERINEERSRLRLGDPTHSDPGAPLTVADRARYQNKIDSMNRRSNNS